MKFISSTYAISICSKNAFDLLIPFVIVRNCEQTLMEYVNDMRASPVFEGQKGGLLCGTVRDPSSLLATRGSRQPRRSGFPFHSLPLTARCRYRQRLVDFYITWKRGLRCLVPWLHRYWPCATALMSKGLVLARRLCLRINLKPSSALALNGSCVFCQAGCYLIGQSMLSAL